MRDRNHLKIDLDDLEITMFRIITALTEAVVRQDAMERRGPVISPNPEAWETYIDELKREFISCNQQLDEYLASIDWKDAPLPSNPAHWPGWWTAVRHYANRTRYTLQGLTN